MPANIAPVSTVCILHLITLKSTTMVRSLNAHLLIRYIEVRIMTMAEIWLARKASAWTSRTSESIIRISATDEAKAPLGIAGIVT